MGNGAVWDFSLTATEMQAAQIIVSVVDAATKTIEDQCFIIETYGNASAQHPVDLADSVRAGLTALPNAAAAASGGLPILGTNASAISFTAGLTISSTTGDALALSSSGGNGNGLNASGNGTGNGLNAVGGATGNGIRGAGGATSGDGLVATGGTLGNGINATGTGSGRHGFNAAGG